MTSKTSTPPIAENFVVRASLGILLVMGSGLVWGTRYIVELSSASDRQAQDLVQLRSDVNAAAPLQTDIAVIKAQVETIGKQVEVMGQKLDRLQLQLIQRRQ